jgi:crossover junction endodeoxyribonuclease RuvC
MCVIIGIDIGLSGCAARLGPGLAPKLVDLQAVADGPKREATFRGKKREFQPMRLSGRGVLDLLHELVPAGHTALVVFEDVRARPMGNGESHFNSFQSQNSLVMSRGVIQAAIDIAGFRSEAVQPAVWKRLYGLGGADKEDSLAKARQLYPGLGQELKRKKDHNRAESLLIAHFALKRLT